MTRHRTRPGLALLALLLLAVLAPLLVPACTGRPTLRIMAADALAHSFRRLTREYARLHPEVDVSLETQGSIILGRLAALRPCDVLAVADSRLIRRLLTDTRADWSVTFATTEMVLVYTERSRAGAELTAEGWPAVLLRPDVRLGLANPDQDPCGYFTLLAWSLAERHYAVPGLRDRLRERCPPERLAWDAAQVLSRMQAGEGDVAFAYRCHAQDMALPCIPLPAAVNLGDPALEAEYATASVSVPDFRGGSETMPGTVVSFGVTIPREARSTAEARDFLALLLGPEGRAALAESSIRPLEPPRTEVWGAPPPPEVPRG